MTWERLRESYDAVADAYEAAFVDELDDKPDDRARLQAFAAAVDDPVLDLGCGPGQVGAAVAAALAVAVLVPVVRADVAPVPVPPGAIRFGALNATGAAFVQCAHRGGVVAVAVLVGSAVETGYAALAIGIALGATYAVLQTFTVTLPHLAGRSAADGGAEGGAGFRSGCDGGGAAASAGFGFSGGGAAALGASAGAAGSEAAAPFAASRTMYA